MASRDRQGGSAGAATIFQVAEQAGVSITTVSHVYSGNRRVSAATRERVLEVAERLGYQPRASARALATGRSMTMALQHSMSGPESILNPFFEQMLVAMSETAVQAGYSYVFVPPDPTAEIFIGPLIDERRIDGALLIDPVPGDRFVEAVIEHGLPSVSLGRIHGHPERTSVDYDHDQACMDVLAHLADAGYQRPALLSLPVPMSYAVDTAESFARRAPAGAPSIALDEFSEQAAYARALDLLRAADRPDAFYCLSDVLALGVARAAAELGLSVPGDVGLVGVGDTAPARDAPIALTSVRVYPEKAGRLLVETLVAAIESDGSVAPPPLLPAEVVARESTARRGTLA